ncbi:MAG: hypothetical protein ACFFA0_09310 [Promethearchaeota archaeon]
MIILLGLNGYLNGCTALLVVVFCASLAIGFYIRAIKLDAKLLKWGAGMGLFAGLLWLGPTTDFLLVLTTENHISYYFNTSMYGVLSYIWVGPSFICGIYVGSELIAPEKKKALFALFIPLAITFTIVLIIDQENTFTFTTNEGDLIDSQFVYLSPSFILISIFLTFILVFNGLGALNKATKTTGEIRKRFLYLTFTFFLFVVVAVFDAFIDASVFEILYIVRLSMICCAWSTYLALKP